MTRFDKYIFIALALFSIMLTACDGVSDAPDMPDNSKCGDKTAVLLYAVASNNLASSLISDLREIKSAAPDIDLRHNTLYVYYLTNNEPPALYKLAKGEADSEEYDFVKIKEYDRSLFSTDPGRIGEVIGEFQKLSAPASTRGVIFWSHGTGWIPDFSTHQPQKRSFGWDQSGKDIDRCDVIELADAIPDGFFDFIWFDCCYMSGIELAYQLRDKADWFVAYPTEVWSDGMPYDLTLPLIMLPKPNLIGAARLFADYYLKDSMAVTIAVCDLTKIERVASLAEKCVTGTRPSRASFHNYGRNGIGPFFDFGDYTRRWADGFDGEWDTADFDKALDELVVYKAASSRDFSRKEIDPEKFSGLTVNYFDDLWDEQSDYYMKLDWFKRVYTTIPEY